MAGGSSGGGSSSDKSSRTLPPSAKRRKESRRNGQVSRSPDLSGWGSLLAMTYLIPTGYGAIASREVGLVDAGMSVFSDPTRRNALRLLGQGLDGAVLMAGMAALVTLGLVLVLETAQSRPTLAWRKLKPSTEHISPMKGFKRQFSASGAMELPKQVVKLAMVAVVAYFVVRGMARLVSLGQLVPLGALLSYSGGRLLALTRYVAVAGTALGVADWWWKRRQNEKAIKMSPQDVKEENRQEEGAPEARKARRKAQMKIYRSRLTGSVEGADLVVVNPTHVAVGLSYTSGTDAAPRVVARGVDSVALQLKLKAADLGIPVVEDVALARAVYEDCVVGEVIPVELYAAVAALMAHVYTMKARSTS